jgi:ketosteroid isomerase-like protein
VSKVDYIAKTIAMMERMPVDPVGMIRDDASPQLRIVNELPDNIPFGGRYAGHYGLIEYMGELARGIEMGPLEYPEIYCEGTTVVGIGREQSVAKSTGRSYDVPYIHVFEWNEEGTQLLSLTEYNDTSEMIKAFD